jgi:hypothetical protein
MAAKVAQSLDMIARHPHLEIIVCSGLRAGVVQAALDPSGYAWGAHAVGTHIHAS